MKSFITAVEEVLSEDEGTPVEEQFIEFEMGEEQADGTVLNRRTLRAYHPTDGQLAFMLAALGRGQSNDSRFASILNIMFSSLRSEDADYIEGRMLSRGPDRLPMPKIEEIFEFLTEEWFARPTQPPSGSADSPPNGGKKSKQPTTKSTSSDSDPTDS